MGIPCYFVSLIRKYPELMVDFERKQGPVDLLYLDSNSIVYDALRDIDVTEKDVDGSVIKAVLAKLDEYLSVVAPREKAVIAFDGVAPAAKTSQQRERRYRSSLERSVQSKGGSVWDTCKITPGTEFMERLMTSLTRHYNRNKKVLLCPSTQPGEGEQKIFENIRSMNLVEKSVVVYGLDADLIMLSLLHYTRCKSLSLYRETPHFIRSISRTLQPGKTYLLDVRGLADRLYSDLGGRTNCVRDYVLMCFVMGNDFLPHFPSISLRDGGHDIIMREYNAAMKSEGHDVGLSTGDSINWRVFKKLIRSLGEREAHAIRTKVKDRERLEGMPARKREKQSIEDSILMDIPVHCRGLEKAVMFAKPGWRERYYRVLQGVEPDSTRMKMLAHEYLRGIEWTWSYYVSGCKDWRWCYPVSYPPLFSDLVGIVPDFSMELLPPSPAEAYTPEEQLLRVVPARSAGVVPIGIRDVVGAKGEHIEHKWAFCRYFWEGNIEFRDHEIISVETLA